jgi:NTP pyrophosphatase (non-canonical NTP hydrolase)
MNFEEYGKFVESMWFSGDSRELGERDIAIMGLGIGGEMAEVLEKAIIAAGRVQELIKKEIRDKTPARSPELLKELGDVYYYTTRIGQYFGYTPTEIVKANVEKLTSRRERGTERGSGDHR